MVRIWALCLCLLLSTAGAALAGAAKGDDHLAVSRSAGTDEQTAVARETNKDKETKAKEMSGMSIVGNDEAPKSLYIVPWKSSEIGVQTSLDMMLTEGDVPVDREVFKRKIEFYRISTGQ